MPSSTHIPSTPPRKRAQSWATSLIFALLVHGLLGWLPLSMHTPPPPPPPLRIQIVARPVPPPPPPPPPRPRTLPRPITPPKPTPKRKSRRPQRPPKRQIRQIPSRPPVPPPPLPRPITTSAPRPQTVPVPLTQPLQALRATPPTPPAPPTPPSPPAPPGPPVDLGPYRRLLGHAIERHKRYPPMAQRMGLEGLVVLRLRITSQGSLATPPSIERSSGYGVLDQEAVRMVSAALPLPILPTGFRRPWAEFRIPVRFALEN